MKVTPWNILKFWKRLMFPPHREDYYRDRLTLKADLSWEPWLHASVWIGVILTLIFGETNLIPPVDFADWTWLVFGLAAPVVGFSSVWMLANCEGRYRYIGLWLRMAADAGLVVALISYLAHHIQHEVGCPGKSPFSIMADTVLAAAAWYTATLVYRDIKFLRATEHLASEIYEGRMSAELEQEADGR